MCGCAAPCNHVSCLEHGAKQGVCAVAQSTHIHPVDGTLAVVARDLLGVLRGDVGLRWEEGERGAVGVHGTGCVRCVCANQGAARKAAARAQRLRARRRCAPAAASGPGLTLSRWLWLVAVPHVQVR